MADNDLIPADWPHRAKSYLVSETEVDPGGCNAVVALIFDFCSTQSLKSNCLAAAVAVLVRQP